MSDGLSKARAEGVHERITQFPALVYGAGHVRAAVAAHAAGRGEFAKEQTHPGNVLSHLGMDFRISSFEVDSAFNDGPPWPGPAI